MPSTVSLSCHYSDGRTRCEVYNPMSQEMMPFHLRSSKELCFNLIFPWAHAYASEDRCLKACVIPRFEESDLRIVILYGISRVEYPSSLAGKVFARLRNPRFRFGRSTINMIFSLRQKSRSLTPHLQLWINLGSLMSNKWSLNGEIIGYIGKAVTMPHNNSHYKCLPSPSTLQRLLIVSSRVNFSSYCRG